MHKQLTKEETIEAEKKRIFERITIRRSMVSSGRVRPEGYIFYNIVVNDFMNQRITGSRLIDLEKENRLGEETVVENIKIELAKQYFKQESIILWPNP